MTGPAKRHFLSLFRRLNMCDNLAPSVGIDGSIGQWLAVRRDRDGLKAQLYPDIADLCHDHQDAAAIMIDIPIGLPESADEARLRPDRDIARLLGPGRRNSVFNVPFRQIVMATDLAAAWDLNFALGAKMQPVGMALRGAIRSVDLFLQHEPVWKNRLIESHPEFAFYTLGNRTSPHHSKKTPEGKAERIQILERYEPGVGSWIDEGLAAIGKKRLDDLIDALCLAIIGQLGQTHGFRSFPDEPAKDQTGLLMQIVTADLAYTP